MRKYFHKLTIKRCRNLKTQSKTICAVFVYFFKGVLGKRKYRSVCNTLSMKISKGKGKRFKRQNIMSCKVAKLLSYEKFMAFVKSIDKGWVGNIKQDFCHDLNEDEKVNGCYKS